MIFLIAIVASVVVFGVAVVDTVRGRTAIGGRLLARANGTAHFWGAIAFYFAGSCFLLVLAALAAQREMGCSPGFRETCVVTISVAPK